MPGRLVRLAVSSLLLTGAAVTIGAPAQAAPRISYEIVVYFSGPAEVDIVGEVGLGTCHLKWGVTSPYSAISYGSCQEPPPP